jgi:hypothetical protein
MECVLTMLRLINYHFLRLMNCELVALLTSATVGGTIGTIAYRNGLANLEETSLARRRDLIHQGGIVCCLSDLALQVTKSFPAGTMKTVIQPAI